MKNKFFVAVVCFFLAAGLAQGALVAQYEFESDFQSSVGTHHGTANGGAAIVLDSERGNVLGLNGTSSYVQINNFNYNSESSTSLSFWFNTGGQEDYFAYMFNHGPEFRQYDFDVYTQKPSSGGGVNTRMQTKVSTVSSGRLQITAPGPLTDSKWHMYSLVKSGSTMSVYIDGELAVSGSIPTPDGDVGFPSGYDIFLGARQNRTSAVIERFFDGMLDDVRIYDEALSAGDVAVLYSTTVPEPTTIALLSLGGLIFVKGKKRKMVK